MKNLALMCCLGAALALAGCGGEEPETSSAASSTGESPVGTSQGRLGDAAVWLLTEGAPPSDASLRVPVTVARLGCNGGVTGAVLEPSVEYRKDEVVVTFHVEPNPDDGHCPGNAPVAHDLVLDEPLDGRRLIDGQCQSGREAAATTHCAPTGVRWTPESDARAD